MADVIIPGQGAVGSLAQRLLANNFDVRLMRPYIGKDGRSFVDTVAANAAGEMEAKALAVNTAAVLRKDDWTHIDSVLVKAARPRLRIINDLRSAGLVYKMPNGMAHSVLQTENQTDIGRASISMDALKKTDNERPEYNLTNLPLPIISKDFSFSLRQLMASRNSGSPLDLSMAEAAVRKCAEEAERMVIGTDGSLTYGGGTIYGLVNFPNRITKSMTLPSASGWTGKTLLQEVIDMKKLSQDKFHYGPWAMYVSPAWDAKLDEDYSDSKGEGTLRERIAKVEGISSIRTLDFLTGYQVILVQQTADVFRLVEGLDFTTVQWESQGGLELNFKVMGIFVPQARTDAAGNTGIVHGTAS